MITVAGGNGLDQLNFSVGVYVDDNQNIYVADYMRIIVLWSRNVEQRMVRQL
jgi:hypothetical protein